MRTLTIADIRSWKPCYGPERHLHEDWQGTVLDILEHETIPWEDKLWVVCRPELLSDKLLRLFAVWSARQVQYLITDPRSIAALDVAERFANGQASNEERVAAWDAAGAAAWAAAGDAARDAAWAAAWAAAWDAARDAARAAAWAAAGDAARAAAGAAARAAAKDAQNAKLIEMVKTGIETGDVE